MEKPLRLGLSSSTMTIRPPSPLRQAITAAYRRDEEEALAPMIRAAALPDEMRAAIARTARRLAESLRANRREAGVESLIREYALSSQEGVALMCLAEALLRIPDDDTRDALIRDKIADGTGDRIWAGTSLCSSTPPHGGWSSRES